MSKTIKLVSAYLLILVMLAGCFGNFTLTRKLYEWNSEVGDKFVNNLVFWVFNIIPVYGVANFADVVLFNLIEFWTGENPLAMVDGVEVFQYAHIEGVDYQFMMSRNYIEVIPMQGNHTGEVIAIEFDEMLGTWNLIANGERHQIAKMGENKVDLFYPDGRVLQKDLVIH